MSDLAERTGSCLCGAIQIVVTNAGKSVGACHCRMCRKWGGGPLMAIDCGTEVSFKGEDTISVFNSSAWAERGFCSKCGSHLYYRLKENNQYIVPVGLVDDDDSFVFDHQVFIDEKPSFYCFSNETHSLTGAEVFAKYAPPSDG